MSNIYNHVYHIDKEYFLKETCQYGCSLPLKFKINNLEFLYYGERSEEHKEVTNFMISNLRKAYSLWEDESGYNYFEPNGHHLYSHHLYSQTKIVCCSECKKNKRGFYSNIPSLQQLICMKYTRPMLINNKILKILKKKILKMIKLKSLMKLKKKILKILKKIYDRFFVI